MNPKDDENEDSLDQIDLSSGVGNRQITDFENSSKVELIDDLQQSDSEVTTLATVYAGALPTYAEVEFEYSWSKNGKIFYCSAMQYRAGSNGRKSGNLHFKFVSLETWGFEELTRDNGIQDGVWRTIAGGGSVISEARDAVVYLDWEYDIGGSGDRNLRNNKTFVYTPSAPSITPKNVTDARLFDITGTDAITVTGASVTVFNTSNVPIANGTIYADGTWKASVSIPAAANSLSLYAKQTVNGKTSVNSNTVTVTLAAFATITSPTEGVTVRIENLVFTGTTNPGANIVVVRNDDHYKALTESKVEPSGSWTRPLLSTLMLPSGELKVEAQYVLGSHGYSPIRTITVESYPIIQTPAASTEQATTFTVTGTGGRPGATLYIQKDQDPSTVYGTTTATASNWSVQATLPPGRQTVTPEQVMGGVRSKPGVPRTYIVKPPKVTGLAASVDADSNLTLSGPGYQGAEVVIYLTNVSEPIATTPVTASIWSTVIKDWLPGSYTFDVKQRVPDSAGGWIESDWSDRLSLNAPVPVPRLNVEVSPEGIPRFYGTAKYWPNQLSEVEVCIEDTSEPIVPIVPVAGSGTWSSTARQPWEPDTYQVVARLGVAGQLSLWTSAITVIIPVRRPPPPTIDPVEDNGLSPWFRGNCAAGATVTLTFTHPPTTPVNATVSGPTWSHQRALPFTAGVVHGVSATQTVDGDTSLPVFTTFTLTAPTPQPAITYPPPKEETDSDLTVTGDNGKAGASMQLWDARDKKPLGHPVILTHNGVWSISLYALVIDSWFISAQQTHNNRPSEHSDIREFFVVVMPPEFLNPLPGSDLPRTSTLSGKGRPNGRVTVWCKGGSEPLLRDVLIGPDGVWEGSVTRAVGAEVLWATQTFEGKTSKPSVDVPCRFVPHAVVPESPLPEELLGKTVTVSGFAVPDDHITLKRGTAVLGETLVLSDRTWSITAKLEQPDGAVTLSVVASSGEFHSAPSEWVGQLGLYLPEFTKPAAGQWGLPVMRFAGLGKSGLGTLMSWYNPDVVLAESVPVTSDGWAATSAGPLAEGAHWCRFWQTLSTGTPISDCAESGRFDVRNESPNGS